MPDTLISPTRSPLSPRHEALRKDAQCRPSFAGRRKFVDQQALKRLTTPLIG